MVASSAGHLWSFRGVFDRSFSKMKVPSTSPRFFVEIKYCVLDLGSYASMPAPNERDTLKLKENYANDNSTREEVCGAENVLLGPFLLFLPLPLRAA